MPQLQESNREPHNREKQVRAFMEAEASLRLPGMEPYQLYYDLKQRILTGEIDFDEAVMILEANYPSNPPDAEEWESLRQYNPMAFYEFMESLDPELKSLASEEKFGAEYYRRLSELETTENYVALTVHYDKQEAARKLAADSSTAPDLPNIK